MRIRIIAVGRLKKGPERELCSDYLKRFAASGRSLGLALADTAELDESRAGDGARRKGEEAAAIAARLPGERLRIAALDERGEQMSSEDFAGLIGGWRDEGAGEAVFLIGGPDGLDPDLAARADRKIAFGRATWPHRMVRMMLAEQLYRAATILAGHPYHRA